MDPSGEACFRLGAGVRSKVGTVTMDVASAVEVSKADQIEYPTNSNAIVHLVIGKRDFEQRVLLENYLAVIEPLIGTKPSTAKAPPTCSR